MEVLRLTADGFLLAQVHAAPGLVRAEPFDAVELDLGLLFDAPDEPDTPDKTGASSPQTKPAG